jgi:hypothetical protein
MDPDVEEAHCSKLMHFALLLETVVDLHITHFKRVVQTPKCITPVVTIVFCLHDIYTLGTFLDFFGTPILSCDVFPQVASIYRGTLLQVRCCKN